MQFYIKRTVLVYLYLTAMQVTCFPGMLNENNQIAQKLQCQISNQVDELLQIDILNNEEFGLFRTHTGHAVIFEDFEHYSLDQNVLTFINKKVSLKYIMNLRFSQSVDVEHSLQEGLNFVYIKTKLNFYKDVINLHILNIFNQGQLRQIIQETNNGIVYSFTFHEQQDYFVQVIFATLHDKIDLMSPFMKQLSKEYLTCQLQECKNDKQFEKIISFANIGQLEPKHIKQAYLKTSKSILYYKQINHFYLANINLEDDQISNHIEFQVECIQLMENSQNIDGIVLEWNQYFCINNLVYHFKIHKTQNQGHSKNYFLLFQVNHDKNVQELILEILKIIDTLKCLKDEHTAHNLQKIKERNISFIQQIQTQDNLVQANSESKPIESIFQEEKIQLQDEISIQPSKKESILLMEKQLNEETVVEYLEIQQMQGQISLIQIEEDNNQQLNQDDIFSQPLQVEEALHQKRLNQIEQEEKRTQEIQEQITFDEKQYQVKQQNEDIVFDDYNKDQLEWGKQVDPPKIEEPQKDETQEHHTHHHHHQNEHHHHKNEDYQSQTEDSYDKYTHHHHHHHNYENKYQNEDQNDKNYLEHHHHRRHHHYYQQDNTLTNQGRPNLRGTRYSDVDDDPQIVDKIVIEYNFSQKQINEEKQPKDHKKENTISGPKKEKQQEEENQQNDAEQNEVEQNETAEDSNESNTITQEQQQEENETVTEQAEDKNEEENGENETSEKQNKKKNQAQDKNKDKNKTSSNKDKETQQNKDKTINSKNKSQNKAKEENEDKEQENQENQEEQENQDDAQEDKSKTSQNKSKTKKKEDCKKNKKKKGEEDKQEEEKAQDEEQQEEKEEKQTGEELQEENKEEEAQEEAQEEEQMEAMYDDYGRYKANDPFYHHRQSKRGRVPFNYPTQDPFQDMYEDEIYWRYSMMKKQQSKFPFNGYPYRHRVRKIDHSPFPHVNSYYKQHPFQKQTFNNRPLYGRDFFPDEGYGMSRVTDVYKGRYTDPEQVLREVSLKHQQEKMWRDSLRQYREAVGYSRGESEYFDDYVPWQFEQPQGSGEKYQINNDEFLPYQVESQEQTYDYLNDPQFKFRQGKRELVKNFPKTGKQINYDENTECFVVYDQCNFSGNRLDLCGEYPEIPPYFNNFKVFSFIVPENLQIKLFQSTDFQDGLQNVEGTQDCLQIPYELVPAQQ